MKICFAQINPIVGDVQGNKEKIISSMRSAEAKGADIVIFPELTMLGYPPKDILSRKKLIAENKAALDDIQKAAGKAAAVIGFVDETAGELFNSAAVVQEKKTILVQHKTHLPNYDVFDEKRYFKPADGSSAVIEIAKKKVGITICEDIWLDGPVESLKKIGAQMIINISASPFCVGKELQREEVLKKRCKKNSIPIAYCNLIGGQDDLIFDGHSYYFDAEGEKIFEAPCFEEGLFFFDTESAKKNKNTYIIDDVEQVYKALALGIKDYLSKNGFKKAVIGLSGGIDSALTAVLAAEALGKENVLGITMPSKYSSSGSVDDSYSLAKNLGIDIKTIPIKQIFDSYIATLAADFKGTKEGVAEENVQARIRGNILMAFSNKFGNIVLSTGNKSELAVGYCTLYGDMSGGLAVISDVPKTLVYKLSRYYNKMRGKEIIPRATIEKAPSAELRPDQKDSDSLPEYDILDQIIDLYVEKGLGRDEIVKQGFEKETVIKVIRLIKINEYKRHQAALGLKVTSKAFGSGRRIPITNRWSQ